MRSRRAGGAHTAHVWRTHSCFTGKLVLEYLRDVYAKKPTEFTFALGGRTESKVTPPLRHL